MSAEKNFPSKDLDELLKGLHELNPDYAKKYLAFKIEKARDKMKKADIRMKTQLYIQVMFAFLAFAFGWMGYPGAAVSMTGAGALSGKLLPAARKMLPGKKSKNFKE